MTDKSKPGDGATPQASTLAFTDLDKIMQRLFDNGDAQIIPLLNSIEADDEEGALRLLESVLVLAPKDLNLVDIKGLIEGLRNKPKRREGTHTAQTLEAFNLLTNRFKSENSAIFADGVKSTLTTVFDFHPEGNDNNNARFGKHRAFYQMPFSKEWLAWTQANSIPMPQSAFAEFVEDRIADIAMPDPSLFGPINDAATGGDWGNRSPLEELAYLAKTLGGKFALPTEMVTLSRGLEVREGLKFRQAQNIDTGEQTIIFDTELSDGSGAPLRVPNLFMIAIPVYEAGEAYAMAVRLRFRRDGANLIWVYQMYRVDKVLDYAFKRALKSAKEATDLPLYQGSI